MRTSLVGIASNGHLNSSPALGMPMPWSPRTLLGQIERRDTVIRVKEGAAEGDYGVHLAT